MLSNEITNTGRQLEFDFAKVFAIFFMVIIHVYENMSSVDYSQMPNNAFHIILEFLGGPLAAPVFMFAMGVGMVYTRHNSYQEFAKRGLKLLIIGYTLNFFRNTLLIILAHWFGVSTDQDQPLLDTLGLVDILQFAGMTFLAIALFKWIKVRGWKMIMIAFLMQGIGTVCMGYFDSTPKLLQYLLGLLFHTNKNIAFPLFLWFIYPVLGIYFARILVRVNDKRKFYNRVLSVSLFVFICASIGMISQDFDLRKYFALANETYYKQNFHSTIWISSVVLIAVSIYYYISQSLEGKYLQTVKFISSNLNTIYIIQWLIIAYTIAVCVVFDIGKVPEPWIVPIGGIIAIVSIVLANLIGKRKRTLKNRVKVLEKV